MKKLLAAIGLSLALLAPAGAARAAEIDCGIEQIKPDLRARADAMVGRVLHDDNYQPTAEDEDISVKLFEGVEACAQHFGWNEAKKEAALRFVVLRLTRDRAAAELRGLGVATPLLEKIVAANPTIFAAVPDSRTEAHDKLVADATAAGIPMSKPVVEMLVLAYFGSETLANQAAGDFAGA
jgi:hypothetical protein